MKLDITAGPSTLDDVQTALDDFWSHHDEVPREVRMEVGIAAAEIVAPGFFLIWVGAAAVEQDEVDGLRILGGRGGEGDRGRGVPKDRWEVALAGDVAGEGTVGGVLVAELGEPAAGGVVAGVVAVVGEDGILQRTNERVPIGEGIAGRSIAETPPSGIRKRTGPRIALSLRATKAPIGIIHSSFLVPSQTLWQASHRGTVIATRTIAASRIIRARPPRRKNVTAFAQVGSHSNS